MEERPSYPARRDPDGFIAQRIGLGEKTPWVLTRFEVGRGVRIGVFADADVADWQPVADQVGEDGDLVVDVNTTPVRQAISDAIVDRFTDPGITDRESELNGKELTESIFLILDRASAGQPLRPDGGG